MGNKTSTSKDVIPEHLEVVSTCMNSDDLKENKSTGQLYGLKEAQEDMVTFALTQLDIIIKKSNALAALRAILKNDAIYIKNQFINNTAGSSFSNMSHTTLIDQLSPNESPATFLFGKKREDSSKEKQPVNSTGSSSSNTPNSTLIDPKLPNMSSAASTFETVSEYVSNEKPVDQDNCVVKDKNQFINNTAGSSFSNMSHTTLDDNMTHGNNNALNAATLTPEIETSLKLHNVLYPKKLPIDEKKPPTAFYHAPFVKAFIASLDDIDADTLRQWETKLMDLNQTGVDIEYGGRLIVVRGSCRIELMEPKEGSSRAVREFGSWRFFKLSIPKSNKIDQGLLKRFLLQDINSRCLPFAENQFHLELYMFSHDDGGTKAIFIVKLRSEIGRTNTRSTTISAKHVQEWHIKSDENQNMALGKYIKRFKLAHSKTTPSVTLSSTNIMETEKANIYSKNGNLMNDGCGYIDEATFKDVFKMLRRHGFHEKIYPTAIQVRLGSAKGVLLRTDIHSSVLDSDIKLSGCKVVLPSSMIKFKMSPRSKTDSQRTVDVLRTNIDYCRSPAKLNRENIFLLAARGIKFQAFKEILKEWMDYLKQSFVLDVHDIINSTTDKEERRNKILKESDNLDNHLIELLSYGEEESQNAKFENQCGLRALLAGFSCGSEPFVAEIAERTARRQSKRDMEKFKIVVKKSRRLMMIPDPSGKLAPGECFINITFEDEKTMLPIGVLSGDIVAMREPSYFHGDVVVLKCVEIQELKAYTNVLILSIQVNEIFPCSIAEILSGGDFDGDMAFVSWDKRLIPRPLSWKQRCAISSIGQKHKDICVEEVGNRKLLNLDFKSRMKFIVDTVFEYRETAEVWISKLANRQRLVWDKFGIDTPKSIEIAKYCFYAVDRPKDLAIEGKTVSRLIDEIDKMFIKENLARQVTTKKTESKSAVEYKLPTYDHRATDYIYKSDSVLGKLFDQYERNLTVWSQLNSDREKVSNGGEGGQLDFHLMDYKRKYFAAKKEGWYRTEIQLRDAVKKLYDTYLNQLSRIRSNSLRFNDIWYELIKLHYFNFKSVFPDANERSIASVILYEYIRSRDYARNPIRIHNAGKYAWHVCIDELCSIKAQMLDGGRQYVITRNRGPLFMKLFQHRAR